MAAIKSSKDARQVGLSWHEKRCEVREKSTKGKYFRSSLQCLDNSETLLLLESILQRSKQGHNLYSSFSEFSCPNKQAFRDKLLDPHHGLPVYKESSVRLFGLVMKEKCFFLFQL